MLPLAALLAATAAQPTQVVIPVPAAAPIARVAYLEGVLERAPERGEDWKKVNQGDRVRLGDRLRTGHESLVRLELPFMTVTLSSTSALSIPRTAILSIALERGRLEAVSEGEIGDIVKIQSGPAEVRGQGRAIVRREGPSTQVAVLAGAFRVVGAGKSVSLGEGQGSVVRGKGEPSSPSPLPAPPQVVAPSSDPRYVKQGDAIEVSWISPNPRHHIQVLGIDSEAPVLETDVGVSPHPLKVPWLGTFRWRVSALGQRGLESRPSSEGLICVVEK